MRAFCLILVLLVACKKSDAEVSAPPAPATGKSEALGTVTPTPAVKAAAAEPGAAAMGPASAGGLTWSDAAGLVRRQPKSSMRAAEYGVEGDPQAELTVFYFGEGQGGAVEPNIARWIGQFTQPDGSDTAQRAKRSEIQVQGMSVSLVEATGNYGGGMGAPGAAPSGVSDAMLLGAIAVGPKGPVFFKFTGPRAAVTAARPAFDALIQSLHAQ